MTQEFKHHLYYDFYCQCVFQNENKWVSSAIDVNIKYSIFIVTVNISHFQNVAKHLENYSLFSKDLYLVVMKIINFAIGSNISFEIDIFKSIPLDIDDLFSLT